MHAGRRGLCAVDNLGGLTLERGMSMSNNYTLTDEDKLAMLGNWISGNHREDIKLIEGELFQRYGNMYRAAVEGKKSLQQLFAEKRTDGVSLTDIMQSTSLNGTGSDFFSKVRYDEAVAKAYRDTKEILIERLRKTNNEDSENVMRKITAVIAAIDRKDIREPANMLAAHFMENLEEEKERGVLKFGKGFEELDFKSGSMRRGQLIVLASRPAGGKSAAALQIAYNVYERGAKVLYFPLEMTTQETVERILLQNKKFNSLEEMKIASDKELVEACKFLDEIEREHNFLIYEGMNMLDDIQQIVREQKPDFLVVDQLTQVRPSNKTKDIREKYIQVTAEFKALAMKYGVAILLLTQLNRDAEIRQAPTIENLHESDATGQNADMVLIMFDKKEDEKKYNSGNVTNREKWIRIVKNRSGKSGESITEYFDGTRTRFESTINRNYR